MSGIRTTRLKVAAAQIAPVLGDIDANVEIHLDYIQRAHEANADVLVFPELSLTGYDVGHHIPDLGISLEEPLDDPRLMKLAEAAGDMHVVVGFVEEGYGAQYFNTAAVLQHGDYVHMHRKLNLANYGDMQEAKFFAGGRYIEPLHLPSSFTAAVLLCSDMWNPPLVHIAALYGATVLLVPTNSSIDNESGDATKPSRWDLVLRFYASLYGLPVVFVNRVGAEGNYHFWGGSRVIGANGEELVSANGDDERMLVAELDFDEVRRARHALPTVRDSNLELIHREIDRLVRRVGVPNLLRR